MNGGLGFTLDQCYDMTMIEVDFYMSLFKDKPPPRPGEVVLPTAGPTAAIQQKAYTEWYWRLSPIEKLERALAKRQ